MTEKTVTEEEAWAVLREQVVGQAVRVSDLLDRIVRVRDQIISLALDTGVSPYSLAEALGVEVWVVRQIADRTARRVR